ncbi:MAG: dicarboxylate/amino acid:cation symporter [Nanoarchaeota archaeon]
MVKKNSLVLPRSLILLHDHLQHLVSGKLYLHVLFAMALGVVVGYILGPQMNLFARHDAAIIAEWLALPGIIFIKVIQMIVVPLIVASIIRGIASSKSMKHLRQTGFAVAAYFILTTTVAIAIGMIVAFWIQPGQYVAIPSVDISEVPEVSGQFEAPTAEELPQAISGVLPVNIFGSFLNADMFQIVVFSIIFGVALVNLKRTKSRPLLSVLGSLQEVCMTVVKWAMMLAPIAVFGLITRLVSQFGTDTLLGIGVYVITVLIGLILIIIFYLILIYILTKRTPLSFLRAVRDVQLLAFSTSSSAAVMPLTMKTAEEKLNISPGVSQFVIPIGATVNMDGTALYQVVATIFLAQAFGIEIGMVGLLLLTVMIVGASIGSPATPGVGIAVLALILQGVGIPLSGIALVIGVDRILDMSRTAVNVTGDLTACTVIDRFLGKKPEQLAPEHHVS